MDLAIEAGTAEHPEVQQYFDCLRGGASRCEVYRLMLQTAPTRFEMLRAQLDREVLRVVEQTQPPSPRILPFLRMLRYGVPREAVERHIRTDAQPDQTAAMLEELDALRSRIWIEWREENAILPPGAMLTADEEEGGETPVTLAIAREIQDLQRSPFVEDGGTCVICMEAGRVVNLNCPIADDDACEAKAEEGQYEEKASEREARPGCNTRVCMGCWSTYVEGVIKESYRGACKPIRCPNPACRAVVPMSSLSGLGMDVSASAKVNFMENARSVLSLQCGSCHNRGSLFLFKGNRGIPGEDQATAPLQDAAPGHLHSFSQIKDVAEENCALTLSLIRTRVAPNGEPIPPRPVEEMLKLPLLRFMRGFLSAKDCWHAICTCLPALQTALPSLFEYVPFQRSDLAVNETLVEDGLLSSLIRSMPNAYLVVQTILRCIPDAERQASLHNQILVLHPKVKSTCCRHVHCYRCKTKQWHEGMACDRYQSSQRSNDCILSCSACGLWLVKGDGCNSISCVCGHSFNWEQRRKQMGDEQIVGFFQVYGGSSYRIAYEFLIRSALGQRIASKEQLQTDGFVHPSEALPGCSVSETDRLAARRFLDHHASGRQDSGQMDRQSLAAAEAAVWEQHSNQLVAASDPLLHEHLEMIPRSPGQCCRMKSRGAAGALGLTSTDVVRVKTSYESLHPPSGPRSPRASRCSRRGKVRTDEDRACRGSYAAKFEACNGNTSPALACAAVLSVFRAHLPEDDLRKLSPSKPNGDVDDLTAQVSRTYGHLWPDFADFLEAEIKKNVLPSAAIHGALEAGKLGPHGIVMLLNRRRHLKTLVENAAQDAGRKRFKYLEDLQEMVESLDSLPPGQRPFAYPPGTEKGAIEDCKRSREPWETSASDPRVHIDELEKLAPRRGLLTTSGFEDLVRNPVLQESAKGEEPLHGFEVLQQGATQPLTCFARNTFESMAVCYAVENVDKVVAAFKARFRALAAEWLLFHNSDVADASAQAWRFGLDAAFGKLQIRNAAAPPSPSEHDKENKGDSPAGAHDEAPQRTIFGSSSEVLEVYAKAQAFAHCYPQEFLAARDFAKASRWLDEYDGNTDVAKQEAEKVLHHAIVSFKGRVPRGSSAQWFWTSFCADPSEAHIYDLACSYLSLHPQPLSFEPIPANFYEAITARWSLPSTLREPWNFPAEPGSVHCMRTVLRAYTAAGLRENLDEFVRRSKAQRRSLEHASNRGGRIRAAQRGGLVESKISDPDAALRNSRKSNIDQNAMPQKEKKKKPRKSRPHWRW